MALDVDRVLREIGQFGPYQIRILVMFCFIFIPITYQTLIMVFMAYEPPWTCATASSPNVSACALANQTTAFEIYDTTTEPKSLYERRCSLSREEWRFADTTSYEGPHQTIVNTVCVLIHILYSYPGWERSGLEQPDWRLILPPGMLSRIKRLLCLRDFPSLESSTKIWKLLKISFTKPLTACHSRWGHESELGCVPRVVRLYVAYSSNLIQTNLIHIRFVN